MNNSLRFLVYVFLCALVFVLSMALLTGFGNRTAYIPQSTNRTFNITSPNAPSISENVAGSSATPLNNL